METNLKIAQKLLISLLVMLTVLGCVSFEDSHQVLINGLNRNIGNELSKSPLARARPVLGRDGYKSVKRLENGNLEHEYNVITPECHIFLEASPQTNIIIGWRIEAPDPEQDCYINQ